MKIVQDNLKESALRTAAAANSLASLLKSASRSTDDQADWLEMAASNVYDYLSILNEGIQTADPEKVLHGTRLLTRMGVYLFDRDLHRTDIESQIEAGMANIHAAAMSVIHSIDRFDPTNLAEARRALQR